ncbi:MAG: acetate/propionate family kinase [Rhizobiales bacterium]|jgi:acetate kinase|nr:acetate/propionate family kinase [Hyphomicrobiales bacterium]
MPVAILVLNAGSSSLKFAVYERRESLPLIFKGNVSSLSANPRLKLSIGNATEEKSLGRKSLDIGAAVEVVAAEMGDRGAGRPVAAVGHRIVHGARDFISPVVLDEPIVEQLRGLIPLAPLHQPQNLQVVDLARKLFPEAVQVGCFDTAFHAARPGIAKSYGLPRALTDAGVQSYGFHGLSYAYISSELGKRYGPEAGGRVIVAHLGNGASLCAMRGGQSVATTMGFSTLDGLVMSTRCGSLDPGIVIHLLQNLRMSVEEVSTLLYDGSGLLGISGISGDMATLLEADSPSAAEAVDLFVYRAGREIGSLAAAIGGLDILVFTAGIGENSPAIRDQICASAGWLGVKIDPESNKQNLTRISSPDSAVDVLVIPTDEERAMAEQILSIS